MWGEMGKAWGHFAPATLGREEAMEAVEAYEVRSSFIPLSMLKSATSIHCSL